jgi:hypothetical protein
MNMVVCPAQVHKCNQGFDYCRRRERDSRQTEGQLGCLCAGGGRGIEGRKRDSWLVCVASGKQGSTCTVHGDHCLLAGQSLVIAAAGVQLVGGCCVERALMAKSIRCRASSSSHTVTLGGA